MFKQYQDEVMKGYKVKACKQVPTTKHPWEEYFEVWTDDKGVVK